MKKVLIFTLNLLSGLHASGAETVNFSSEHFTYTRSGDQVNIVLRPRIEDVTVSQISSEYGCDLVSIKFYRKIDDDEREELGRYSITAGQGEDGDNAKFGVYITALIQQYKNGVKRLPVEVRRFFPCAAVRWARILSRDSEAEERRILNEIVFKHPQVFLTNDPKVLVEGTIQ